MKKLLYILLMAFLLTGCGKNQEITGEVLSVSARDGYTALTVVGREVPVLAGEDTHIYSFSGRISPEKLLSGELVRPIIRAYGLQKQDDGWFAQWICVESIQLPEGYRLPDGTELTVRINYTHTTYMMPDGTELLWEQEPVGPGNVHVDGLPSLMELSPEAQKAITAHYEDQELLYDLDAEIERAYQEYLIWDDDTPFYASHLEQHISPTAANENLIWFAAHVTRPTGMGQHQMTSTSTIFHRETGALVATGELFTCEEAAAGKILLDVSGMPDTQLRREMEAAFRFEYLNFQGNALEVCFPAGSLASQSTQDHLIGIHYEDIRDILQPWAIPDPVE